MRRKTVEEYIETIYILQKREGSAHTSGIAREMDVKPPSVTEMLNKLASDGLVEYQKYHGAKLTLKGEKMAKDLMQKHRVIADFLEIIGVEKEASEIDACRIEHHVSPETLKMLQLFVKFVQESPNDPCWLEHFITYCETGEHPGCMLRK